MTKEQLERFIDLLYQYGEAKFGDEWWPGNATAWMDEPEGAELLELIEQRDRSLT